MAMFEPGHILRSPKGNEYTIIRYLGEGVTAEVYLGERTAVVEPDERFPQGGPVALKVLRNNLAEDIAQSFRDEAVTLRELIFQESKINQTFVLRLAETVTGAGVNQEFLAMEYVTGQPLDKLIEAENFLSEQDALLITSQVLAVLDILHTQVRKSYTDFQLQNIWWQAEEGQIKMMDWNHVSARAAAGELLPKAEIATDLTRLGAYLYQMLTGKGALQAGETARALERRAGMHWAEISTGTRTIICRALHPAPSHRFDSASEFRAAIESQRKLWDTAEDDLDLDVLEKMRPVQQCLSKGERMKEAEVVEAEILVDMLGRRRPGDEQVAAYLRQLATLTEGVSDNWGSGRGYYKSGTFSRVLEMWRPEAEALGRVDLWRWLTAAQIGSEVGANVFAGFRADLDEGIQQMNDEEWTAAQQYLGRVAAQYNGPALAYLMQEVKAHQLFQQAQIAGEGKRWAEAADAYQQIPILIVAIPYADLLGEEYGWQPEVLSQLADQYEKYARDSAANSELLTTLQAIDDFKTLTGRVKEEFLLDPANPALFTFCKQQATKRPLNELLALLTVAQIWGQPGDGEAARLHQAWQETKQRVLLGQAETALATENWPVLLQTLTELGQKTPPAFREKLQARFDTAVQQQWLPVAQQLALALALVEDEAQRQTRQAQLEEMQQTFAANEQAAVDNLLQQVLGYQLSGQNEEAISLLKQAEQFFADQPNVLARIEVLQPQERFRFWARETEKALGSPLLNYQRANVALHYTRYWESKLAQDTPDVADRRAKLAKWEQEIKSGLEMEGKGFASTSSPNGYPNGSGVGSAELAEATYKRLGRLTTLLIVMLVVSGLLLMGSLYLGRQATNQEQQQLAALQAQLDAIGTRLPMGMAVADVSPTDGSALVAVDPTQPSTPTASPTLPPTPTNTPSPTNTPTPTETPEPTPIPLDIGTTFSSPAVPEQANTFYDLPDMVLTAPPGWSFNLDGDMVQLVDDTGITWPLSLTLTSDTELLTNTIPVTITSFADNDSTTALNITWSDLTTTTPLPPGNYQSHWQIDQGNEKRSTDALAITIIPRQTITTTTSVNLRDDDGNQLQVVDKDVTVEVMGRDSVGSRLQVRTSDGVVGWIATQYAEYDFDLADIPVTEQ